MIVEQRKNIKFQGKKDKVTYKTRSIRIIDFSMVILKSTRA